MASDAVRLEPSWKQALAAEFEAAYMQDLKRFLVDQKSRRKHIFPRGSHIFRALDLTPLPHAKVIVIGQDPYHGVGQAHGLCFSVPEGVEPPPSLKNIFQEINTDLGVENDSARALGAQNGCLESWAEQGVLLLNSVLTVEKGRAASHQGRGWERFTDCIVNVLNERCEHLVFLLWGSYAQKKGAIVDRARHLVLTAPHPSPLAAHRGFFGCRHFSRANDYLREHGLEPIDWLDVRALKTAV